MTRIAPFDNLANLAKSLVAVAPSPATSGTTLTLTTGDVAALGLAAPFNAVVWPTGAQPTIANAEIVRCTSITGDQLTIIRNTTTEPNNTFNRTIVIGDQIQFSDSAKLFSDLQTAINDVAVGMVLG